jgi:hypothetical protein
MPKLILNAKSIGREPPKTGQLELWDVLVPGFGLRIGAGGARTFFVMRRLNGRLVRLSFGRAHLGDGPLVEGEYRLPQAREKARQLLSDLQRGIDPKATVVDAAARAEALRAEAARNTFRAVAEAYFADPSRKGGATLKSKAELQRKVRVDLEAWHNRSIADLTRADVREVFQQKLQTSPVAANRLLALIHRVFRWAVREEIVAINVAADIDLNRPGFAGGHLA